MRGRVVVGVLSVGVLVGGCSGGSGPAARGTEAPASEQATSGMPPVPPSPSPRDAQGCRYVRTRLPAPEGLPSLSPGHSDGIGRIAGSGEGPHRSVPVLWHDGRVTTPAIPAGQTGRAIDVDRSGVVMGLVSEAGRRLGHGYLWRHGRAIRLGGKGLPTATDDRSEIPLAVDPVTNRVVELPMPPGRWSVYVSDVLADGSVVGGISPWGGAGDGAVDDRRPMLWQRRC